MKTNKASRNLYFLLYPVLLVAALALSGIVSLLAAPFIALLVTCDIVHRPEKFSPVPDDPALDLRRAASPLA